MKRFRHHRDQGRLTSICETCGETYSGAIEAATFRWQRAHDCLVHAQARAVRESRRTAAGSVKAPLASSQPEKDSPPSPTRSERVTAPRTTNRRSKP